LPEIFLATVGDKNLIVVEVNESGARPYFLKHEGVLKGTYVRLGATSVLASPEVVDDLRRSGRGVSFDEQSCIGFEATDARISEVCALLGERSGRTFTKTDLLNMKLLIQTGDGIRPTNAFALLCDDNPFSHACMRCGLFKTDRSVVIDRKEFGGSIIRQADEAYKFVLSHIRLGMELRGLYRKDVYELPEDALREAALNMAIHRNYTIQESVSFVSVYDGKVEFLSPGMLPWGIDMDKVLSGRSMARNKVVLSAFKSAGLIESFGTGIRKMNRLCADSGLPAPEIKEDGIDFVVTFFREAYVRDRPGGARDAPFGSAEERIVSLLGAGGMTAAALLRESGLTRGKVDYALASLVDRGIVTKDGGRKGAWKLTGRKV
jgi:ATP-dependent DNA helicase RecG